MATNEESYLHSGRPARLLRPSFTCERLERLYRSGSLHQRRGGLQCFLLAAVFFDFYALFLPVGAGGDAELPRRGLTFGLLALNLCLLAWAERGTRARDALWSVVPHVAWLSALTQLVAQLWLHPDQPTPRHFLGWLLLLLYLYFATLPVRFSLCCILAVGTAALYLLTVLHLAPAALPLDVLLLTISLSLCAAILGASSYSMADFQQRRAFLETKQSLEARLIIEEQSAEQERLLLSVLPAHVAVQMRRDLGESFDTQFKKIYMSRHENVSILYADIVGFTAISSTYSASELVKILNELFARFDQLSERYHQLRIKILGDCYYCISGAPQERPDHAILCVHMGLSMVQAIKYVQQTTKSPVDMRVGIHTGAILAGVLGQRQWQFDVYSKDVELANKMESSGKAGRVHISNVTKRFVEGEFELERAFGEQREETLAKAGIHTYFIVRALKPCPTPAPQKQLDEYALQPAPDTDKDFNDHTRANEEADDFGIKMQKELDSREGGQAELKGHASWLSLQFKDPSLEKIFHSAEEAFSPLSLLGGPLVLLCSLPMWRFQPWGPFTWGGACVVSLFAVVLAGATCLGRAVRARWLRRTLALLMIFSLGIFILLDMGNCGIIDHSKQTQNTTNIPHGSKCPYPSYYSYIGVLAVIVISMPLYICYLGKAFLMFVLAGAQCMVNIVYLGRAIELEDPAAQGLKEPLPGSVSLKYALCATLLTISFVLFGVARYTEKARRVLFLRGREVAAQREHATDMTRRNGALIYNILPPHVAAYFLSNTRHHDDLYSQSYAEVGVLFASMPTFADFYSEESINNQGLECLRFLNEVISDFDALLDQPKYKGIIKIKTIGSTYMAASGITDTGDDRGKVPWQHLANLVDFAIDLKKTLSKINEQSFNHFVLKMGVNHGPITAGVIGARKPHYDIWGNTVNVASRMESTGKVGFLQVTDETRKILEPFGFEFEERGLVFVKGKGELLTHYLMKKDGVELKLDSDLPIEPKHKIIYQ
ncbi:hypothetical protein QAD02_020021 [Eretmocerus hayati]|uniref:Uncharacterized protein n=1 Tax=Eretmocerus hayati TaxID=131215 RepID=A0ACC2PNR5_9HYME|nr:hypothetical protein QAD02_020021 [Eretmocerus hayati]